MVTITNYHLRQRKDGKQFIALEIQGDLEMVQSMETGKFYATARRCSITSTFDESTAKNLIGKNISGKIIRVTCDSYEYTIPETGEVINLSHSYEYQPENPLEEAMVNRAGMQQAIAG